MTTIEPRYQRYLKLFHVFFMALWTAAALIMNIKQFFINPTTDGELYGILSMLVFIDDFILIPGAIGVLITSVLYAKFTNWGWFKHKWIVVKWIICLSGIIFGTFALGPWLNEMLLIAKSKGLESYFDHTYIYNLKMLMIFGSLQALTILFAVVISFIRPWQKK